MKEEEIEKDDLTTGMITRERVPNQEATAETNTVKKDVADLERNTKMLILYSNQLKLKTNFLKRKMI